MENMLDDLLDPDFDSTPDGEDGDMCLFVVKVVSNNSREVVAAFREGCERELRDFVEPRKGEFWVIRGR